MWRLAIAAGATAWATVAVQPSAAQGLAPGLGGGPSASAYELTFWQSVATSDDPAQLEAYLSAYPNGAFSNLARLKIAALRQRLGVPNPAPAPDPATRPTPTPPPAPVAATVPSTPPPPVPIPAPVAAAPAIAAATTPAPVAPPTSAVVEPAPVSLAEQLRLLAGGQGTANPAGPAPAGNALPPAPVLAPVPELGLPDHFCSAQARNLFYDGRYKPAMELADRNNKAAIGHLQELRRLYDERGRAGDIAGQNQLAAAARDYDPVAADAFKARSAYDATFAKMLDVPIRNCVPGES
jgi:hypothetical protein